MSKNIREIIKEVSNKQIISKILEIIKRILENISKNIRDNQGSVRKYQ